MRIQISVSGRPGFEQVVYAAFKTNDKEIP